MPNEWFVRLHVGDKAEVVAGPFRRKDSAELVTEQLSAQFPGRHFSLLAYA